MRRIALLLLLVLGVTADAQQIGLQATKPTNPAIGQAIDKVKANGYSFVALEVSMPSSPDKANWLPLRNAIDKAFADGLDVMLRENVSVFGSYWNAATPAYPPSQDWPALKVLRQETLDVLAAECKIYGRIPANQKIENAKEMDIGGVDSPSYQTWGIASPLYSKFQADWKRHTATGSPSLSYCKAEFLNIFPAYCWTSNGPMPEGTIPAQAAQILCMIRPDNYHGFTEIAYTCEGAQMATEAGSIKGVVWSNLAWESFGTFDMNVYEDAPGSLTPIQAAAKFAAKIQTRLKIMLANPLVKHVGISEFNLPDNRIPTGKNPAPYRNAMIQAVMKSPGVAWACVFKAVKEALADHAALYTVSSTGQLVAQGGEVGPSVP